MRTGGRREGSNLWEEGASGRTEMATTLSSRSGRLYRQAGVIGIKAVCEKITVCVCMCLCTCVSERVTLRVLSNRSG